MLNLFWRPFVWWLCDLDFWLVIFIILATFLLWTRWWKGGRILFAIIGMFIFIACVSPVPDFIATFLENRFQRPDHIADDVKGFIVIGFGLDRRVTQSRDIITLNCASQRELALIELSKKYPSKKFVYTAGTLNSPQLKSWSDIMRKFFEEMTGEKPVNIIFEDHAKDTYQNAKYTYDLIKPKPGEKWALVTSAINMPRAVGVFKKVGWDNIIAYPVDYRTIGQYEVTVNLSMYHGLRLWSLMAYEIVGLIFYYCMGYIDELIPSPYPRKNEL